MKPAPPVTTMRFPAQSHAASLVTDTRAPSETVLTIVPVHVRSDSRVSERPGPSLESARAPAAVDRRTRLQRRRRDRRQRRRHPPRRRRRTLARRGRADRRLGRVDRRHDGATDRRASPTSDMHVIHYDRNFGKGYAVKIGALEASGRWIAHRRRRPRPRSVADPDVPRDRAARAARLRHRLQASSRVDQVRLPAVATGGELGLPADSIACSSASTSATPRSDSRCSRVTSPRTSFRLLLVKRFAFDLELLAVATRVRLSPRPRAARDASTIGSPGRRFASKAAARALWDTAAVFYRLRILRTYQRRRQGTCPRDMTDTLSVVIPVHNEAPHLPETIDSLVRALGAR